MPRPSQLDDKRRELLPVVTRAFSELGYRRTSTAELAQRCRVRENILYRLWPDKKAMFIAAIEFVFDRSEQVWNEVAGKNDDGSAAERLLAYEARHAGQFGHARIVFAGLSELDDPDISRALARMYEKYQKLMREQIRTHRGQQSKKELVDPGLTAWAFVGLGTVALIARELKLLSERERARLMNQVGGELLG